MAKNEKKNDPVAEYLVEKIRELEDQINRILITNADLLEYKEQAQKFEELKSLFKLENNVVCLYDKGSHFQDAVATDWTDFGKYLIELLNLKEEEK